MAELKELLATMHDEDNAEPGANEEQSPVDSARVREHDILLISTNNDYRLNDKVRKRVSRPAPQPALLSEVLEEFPKVRHLPIGEMPDPARVELVHGLVERGQHLEATGGDARPHDAAVAGIPAPIDEAAPFE